MSEKKLYTVVVGLKSKMMTLDGQVLDETTEVTFVTPDGPAEFGVDNPPLPRAASPMFNTRGDQFGVWTTRGVDALRRRMEVTKPLYVRFSEVSE